MKDLAIIETILRNRYHYFNEIREGIGLPEKMRAMLISSIAFLALYGAVMGSTHSLWQALSSAAKLPILFLATLLVGPLGIGKTHLAQALAHQACRRGYKALYVNTYKMLQHINGGRADGTLERRFKTYLWPDLLVLDDFGLKTAASSGSRRPLRRHQRALRKRQYPTH